MDNISAHKVDFTLTHSVEVSEATKCLLRQLGCDDWYVARHHNHLFVFHLTRSGIDKYAVTFQCTSPVEKAIYHGSKAWSVSVIPLRSEDALPEDTGKAIKAQLAALT